MTTRMDIRVAACLVPIMVTCAARGQETMAPAGPPAGPQPGDVQVILRAGGAYQFDTDFDDGGEVAVTTYAVSADVRTILTSELSLSFDIGYRVDDYDFSGSTGFGGLDPWEDIHTLDLTLGLTLKLNDQWSIFGGTGAVFAAESGGSLSDGDTYGGFFGVQYSKGREFTLGGGVAIFDRLEDTGVRAFPIIIVNWRLSDQFRIASRTEIEMAGIEAVYSLTDTWELGLGIGYDYRRFRLDDRDVAPDGIGEYEGLILQLRAGYNPSPNLRFSVHGGLLLNGEIQLEDSRGNRISDDDFDAAPLLGAGVRYSF